MKVSIPHIPTELCRELEGMFAARPTITAAECVSLLASIAAYAYQKGYGEGGREIGEMAMACLRKTN